MAGHLSRGRDCGARCWPIGDARTGQEERRSMSIEWEEIERWEGDPIPLILRG